MGRTRERNLHFWAAVFFLWTSTSPTAGVEIRQRGTVRCAGRLEIKQRGAWKGVCLNGSDLLTAQAVCRELGCGAALRAFNVSSRTNQTLHVRLSCPGGARPLGECVLGQLGLCGPTEDTVVECSEPLLPLISSATAGALLLLLLLLLLSLAICLVRRKRRAKRYVPTRFVSRVNNNYESDKEEEENDDYVNVEQIHTVSNVKKDRGTAKVEDGDVYEELDSAEDHNYEEATPRAGITRAPLGCFNAERKQEEEESSDDEGNYENVSQPLRETEVYIYGKQEDIYQNL